MQRKLKCLIIEPNKLPYEKIITNSLSEKQKIVDGMIEYAYLQDKDDVCLICNEEGKLLNMEPNRTIGYDILCGTVALVGYDIEMGEDRSLTDEQVSYYKEYFGEKSIKETENHLVALSLKRNNDLEL